jgi:hypothetical protein
MATNNSLAPRIFKENQLAVDSEPQGFVLVCFLSHKTGSVIIRSKNKLLLQAVIDWFYRGESEKYKLEVESGTQIYVRKHISAMSLSKTGE